MSDNCQSLLISILTLSALLTDAAAGLFNTSYYRTRPANVVTIAGSQVRLRCASADSKEAVAWQQQEDGGSLDTVFSSLTGVVSQPDVFSIRSRYDLVISRISAQHARSFRCTLLYANMTYIVYTVVLESLPVCGIGDQTGQDHVTVDVIENANVTLGCHVAYNGLWAPSMSWSRDNNGDNHGNGYKVTNNTQQGMAHYNLNLRPTRDSHGASYTCMVHVEAPPFWVSPNDTANTGYDHSAPTNTETCSTQLNVLYPPNSIQITANDNDVEGDVVTVSMDTLLACKSDSNPSPTIHWLNADTNDVIAESSDLDLSPPPNDVINVTCVVTYSIDNQVTATRLERHLLVTPSQTARPTTLAMTSLLTQPITSLLTQLVTSLPTQPITSSPTLPITSARPTTAEITSEELAMTSLFPQPITTLTEPTADPITSFSTSTASVILLASSSSTASAASHLPLLQDELIATVTAINALEGLTIFLTTTQTQPLFLPEYLSTGTLPIKPTTATLKPKRGDTEADRDLSFNNNAGEEVDQAQDEQDQGQGSQGHGLSSQTSWAIYGGAAVGVVAIVTLSAYAFHKVAIRKRKKIGERMCRVQAA